MPRRESSMKCQCVWSGRSALGRPALDTGRKQAGSELRVVPPRPRWPRPSRGTAPRSTRHASLHRWCLSFLAAVVVLVGVGRVVSTYQVFSHTADEPAHIAVGMEWLD